MLELNEQIKTNKTEKEKTTIVKAAKTKLIVLRNELVAKGLIAD